VLSIGGVSVSHADGNLSTTQLTVTSGTLNVSLAGGATISAGANGSSTLTLSGTQAQINAALASLSYQGNPNFNGSDTLTVLSTDGNGVTDSDAVSITVSSVNDGPMNTVPGAQTANEDSALSISGVSVNDVDGNLSTTQLTVTNGAVTVSLAGGATISAGANGSATLTLSGTQAQINAALASISYQGSANFAGSDTLTVLSTDADGASDSVAVSITVSAVNDAPAVTSAATATFVENTTGAVYTATRSEVDSGDTVTWTLSGADAGLFTIDAVTGVVSLASAQDFDTPGDANGDRVYEITVRATDSGGLFDQRNVQLTLTNAVVIPPADDPVNPMAGQSAPPPQLPATPASPPPLLGLAPSAPQPADRPLGLPVDAATPASNLSAAGVPGAVSAAAAGIADLNALPPTGAGPAETSTFALVRLSPLEAGSHLRLTGAILQPDAGGHRLFVYHGVPDMRLLPGGSAVLGVPADAFAHTDPAARVHLEARMANGSPLPGWLKFDGLRGVFSGTPPEGVDGNLEIEVVARDTEGREARTKFTLEIEELRAKAAAAGLALGLDVDKEEAEKARQELARQAHKAHLADQARAATAGVQPAKPGAASFSDQVNAAKTKRDPLLERISPSGKDKTGVRR
jgi:VCBS repeat-containing protein